MGREGLDFHLYCHKIYHWNLPANPVDLEQREGRIHRYKGHAVRRNVAGGFGVPGLHGETAADPWDLLFDRAQKTRSPGVNDLVPFWVYEKKDGYKLVRHVPSLPLSRELGRLFVKKIAVLFQIEPAAGKGGKRD